MGLNFKQAGTDFKKFMSGLDNALGNVEAELKKELGEDGYKAWIEMTAKYKTLYQAGRITEANAIMAKFKEKHG